MALVAYLLKMWALATDMTILDARAFRQTPWVDVGRRCACITSRVGAGAGCLWHERSEGRVGWGGVAGYRASCSSSGNSYFCRELCLRASH